MTKLLKPHITHLRASGYSANTINDRERLLRYADDRLPYGVDTPSTEELAEFLAAGGWAGWTLLTYYRHLNGFYTWSCSGQAPHIDWNPLATIKAPRPPDSDPDPVTDDELRLALKFSNPRWQLIIVLAAYAGLRASEIARCRREHITAESIIVNGKGNKTKYLPCHPEIWARVEHMPAGLLFPSPRTGGVMNLTTPARVHFDYLGLYDVHLHRFRHWYGTMLLRMGADIRTVQELMRHASIRSTVAYTAVVDGQRRFAVSTLPVLTLSPLQEAA